MIDTTKIDRYVSIFYESANPLFEIDQNPDFIVDWAVKQAQAALPQNVGNVATVRRYAEAIVDRAHTMKLSPAVLIAQSRHETGGWPSNYPYWTRDRNPAGIGIWGAGALTPWEYNDGDDKEKIAASIHILEMLVRSRIMPAFVRESRDREELAINVANALYHRQDQEPQWKKAYGIARTATYRDWKHLAEVMRIFAPSSMAYTRTHNLNSLRIRFGANLQNCTWACDQAYDTKIVDYLVSMAREFNAWKKTQVTENPPVSVPSGSVPDQLKQIVPAFVFLSGHRQTVGGGGAVGEAERTPKITAAYMAEAKELGYEAHLVQLEDGDNDPDDTVGGLDTASRKAAEIVRSLQKQGKFVVLLDCHFEGTAPSVRGLFAIYPRSDGLTSAISNTHENDYQGRNTADEYFGALLATALRSATGIPLRTGNVKSPGLMQENQTSVGEQGYRLATFAYTADTNARAIRLVVEHGAVTNAQDLAVINGPDYYTNVRKAFRAAVQSVFKAPFSLPAEPQQPTPSKPQRTPISSDHEVFFNGQYWYPLNVWVNVGAKGAGGRVNGGKNTPVVIKYNPGTKVLAKWLVVGQGGIQYYVTTAGYRVPVSEFVQQYTIKRDA